MKNIIAFCALSILSFVFAGCVTTGFKDYYEPWDVYGYFPPEAYLKEDEIPQVMKTSDLDGKFREISSNWYWCIGYSSFNADELQNSEINEALMNLCKEKRAKIAIWDKQYTGMRNGSYSVPHTNYHTYRNSNGYTSTYTTTSYSTHMYSVQRYDFIAYLFVPIPEGYKVNYLPGISVADLTQQDREKYKQNTGCIVDIVYKDTAAYYANFIHGDIITAINGKRIFSADDFFAFRKTASVGDSWNVTIMRDGQEKEIKLTFAL